MIVVGGVDGWLYFVGGYIFIVVCISENFLFVVNRSVVFSDVV